MSEINPPVQIPPDVAILPPGYRWEGNTEARYPVIYGRPEAGLVAIIKQKLVHWYGINGNMPHNYATESYEQGFRLAYTLLMLGDEG